MTEFTALRRTLDLPVMEATALIKLLTGMLMTINAEPYTHPITGTTFPSGTLMLTIVQHHRAAFNDSVIVVITYELTYRAIPWNWIEHPQPDGSIVYAPTAPRIHEEGDFALLP